MFIAIFPISKAKVSTTKSFELQNPPKGSSVLPSYVGIISYTMIRIPSLNNQFSRLKWSNEMILGESSQPKKVAGLQDPTNDWSS